MRYQTVRRVSRFGSFPRLCQAKPRSRYQSFPAQFTFPSKEICSTYHLLSPLRMGHVLHYVTLSFWDPESNRWLQKNQRETPAFSTVDSGWRRNTGLFQRKSMINHFESKHAVCRSWFWIIMESPFPKLLYTKEINIPNETPGAYLAWWLSTPDNHVFICSVSAIKLVGKKSVVSPYQM